MKKTGLFLLIIVLIAAPMLACGFPLPAGTTMMRVSKAECAQDESTESCQARQDAYQLMGKLQAARIPDLNVEILSGIQGSEGRIAVKGSMEYVVNPESEGLGADVHVWIEEGEVNMDATGQTSLNNTELMIIGSMMYTSQDGGDTWESQELPEDQAKFFSVLLGVGGEIGAGLDMYIDPTTFTVTEGTAEKIDGQAMIGETLNLDINAVLGASETLTELMTEAFNAGGAAFGMTEDALGMSIADFATQAVLLGPMMTDSSVSTTLYIGQEDGYIHYVEEVYNLSLAVPGSDVMTASYTLSGHIEDFNGDITVKAPANATQSQGGGLGDSLFGG